MATKATQQPEQQQPRQFRARQLDVNRPMDIVRDESLLDSVEVARDVTHGHQTLDADNEKPKMVHVGGKKTKEIPTPITLDVSTYQVDYLPSFMPRNTYIRSASSDKSFVEYDLDQADLDWLKTTLNSDGQVRLSPERFEMCLFKLEVFNASKLDAVFQGTSERRSAAACSSVDYLTKADAMSMLEEVCGGRDTIRKAVYEYWRKKRADRGKPLLRRLEAPVNYNNPNPLLTFRNRGEARARPQTRRRRENNPDSLDKLQMIGDNIKQAIDLFQLMVRRERKKRDLIYCSIERQRLMAGLPGGTVEGSKRPRGFEDLPDAAPTATNKLLIFKEGKKRGWIMGEDSIMNATSYLAVEPVIERDFDLSLRTYRVLDGKVDVRVGRCGRVIVDRAQVIGEDEEPMESLWEVVAPRVGTSNWERSLASAWGARLDLADSALSKLM
jgi:hypothetical protein